VSVNCLHKPKFLQGPHGRVFNEGSDNLSMKNIHGDDKW